MSKLVVIVGATGKQGGSVITAILDDNKAKAAFRIRGITRDASKPAAKALEAKGVEMVSADLGDKASLVKAFEGAAAVFAVTDYWNTMNKDIEVQQGKNLADAAKEAGVGHYVWSSLINVTKSEIGEYARSIGLPTTFFMPGFYMSNLPGGSIRKDDKSGKFVLSLPVKEDAQLPLIDAETATGSFVKAILMNKEATLGKDIYGADAYYTPQQVVDGFVKAFPEDGKGATFQTTPDDVFIQIMTGMKMPQHVAEEMLQNMHLLNKEYGYYEGKDLKESHSILTDPLVSWTEFVKKAPAFKDLK
ncbi:hypothetical protein P7C73_g3972, partial [Tremellales sp. Uapishka_1]